MQLDLIIRGGAVVDGSGRPAYTADVGIAGDSIEHIGPLDDAAGNDEIDAQGLVVTPGFVDIHSHSDFTLLVDPRAQSSVYQGVTTELVGNCGHGCAPITDPDLYTANIYGYDSRLDITWRTFAEYLEALDSAQPAINVASLVPNGNLRIAVTGFDERPASPDEINQMTRLLEEGLEAGAFGYSTGLESAWERMASHREIVELCRVAAQYDAMYACHTRNKETEAVEAVEEAVQVARDSEVRCQVSHIIPRRGGPPDARQRAIGAVENAHDDGLGVAFDAHTRLHGITNLSMALPSDFLNKSTADRRALLADGTFRKQVRKYPSLISSFALGGWENVYLFKSAASPESVGESIADLTADGADGWDTVIDILTREADHIEYPMVLCHSYTEDELRDTFLHPLCTIGSDATALAVDGPLAGTDFLGAYTWASWFFRRFVTQTKHFALEQAVEKLTARPAKRMGLTDRGRLAEGMKADIAIFDPAEFRETGTVESPSRLAVGMDHVIVNGQPVLRDGNMTGCRSGRALRYGQY
ncbi:MAG: amidohydrolase family protein [Dehalococcoidia bacterium]|nr:amidohydrolase family protein [Dehalococcoidia bacterium]